MSSIFLGSFQLDNICFVHNQVYFVLVWVVMCHGSWVFAAAAAWRHRDLCVCNIQKCLVWRRICSKVCWWHFVVVIEASISSHNCYVRPGIPGCAILMESDICIPATIKQYAERTSVRMPLAGENLSFFRICHTRTHQCIGALHCMWGWRCHRHSLPLHICKKIAMHCV